MSQENVERIRRGLIQFNRGEFDLVLTALLHPDIELTPGIGPLGVGTVRGLEAVRRFWAEELPQALDGLQIEPRRFEDFGEVVLVHASYRARGPGSGIEISQDFVSTYQFEDGRLRRISDHTSRADALAAAGLSE